MAMKPHSKSPISSAKSHVGMLFKDISPGPHESELRFRLIHFWEARNSAKEGPVFVSLFHTNITQAINHIKKWRPYPRNPPARLRWLNFSTMSTLASRNRSCVSDDCLILFTTGLLYQGSSHLRDD
ncbi:hypothetical protein HID58_054589 [Brassica napus]|uniref:Uncharacterized protein n=1 Tax=Brassica napus TaxID=3708 RepID=A0ABQ8AI17_BRANA|nr:hypothetical protein HID58_054589 [Brassica napus]